MGQHFATVLHSSSRVLLQPDLHSDQTRDGQRLQWRADGSSMRALDSMTETETHHNDGAVSVACDQSQIESLSVGQGSADIRSATSCKAKKRLCLQSYKSPQVLCERRPERLWYFAEVRAVGNAKCARLEEAGASLTFKKRGRETRALGLGGGTCIHYLYDQTSTGICVQDRSKRLDIVLDDLGSKKNHGHQKSDHACHG